MAALLQRAAELGKQRGRGAFGLRMPKIDGFETIRQLNDLDPRMSFAVVTGHVDQAYREIGDNLAPCR
ncbi:hypothetical protein [Pelagicoccus sp. SDUM812003]|uniref:response regulator transcription factor n=1 Tax=Pelagicoccus sp. SDUM812003 TaxID=3041267 RepID=UPI00280C73D9|nr:hypothetical protein [Pelagicoccus sp. SDUM812003]MDQ8203420.1 hypothetical protein [Pelagicoccus sp. SDUM812003]